MNYILTYALFSPFVGIAILLFINKEKSILIKSVGIGTSLLTFFLSLVVYFRFDPSNVQYQFVNQAVWIQGLDISYNIGVDGLSLLLDCPYYIPYADCASFFLGIDRPSPQRIRHFHLAFGIRHARRVPRLGFLLVLCFLGSDVDPDVLYHRYLGRTGKNLCGGQIFSLYNGRQPSDADRDPVARLLRIDSSRAGISQQI